MSPLAAALIQNNIATPAEVDRALARQALYGADLPTSLVEVTTVDETKLIQAIASAMNLAPLPSGALPIASDAVLASVPRTTAARFGVFPLALEGPTLTLAVSEPLSFSALDEITRLGHSSVVQKYTPALRIRQALARDYGVPLERRQFRALARLEGRDDPSPSAAPPAQEFTTFSALPSPPSVPSLGIPESEPAPLRIPSRPAQPAATAATTPIAAAPLAPAPSRPASSPPEKVTQNAPKPESEPPRRSTQPGVAPPSRPPAPRPMSPAPGQVGLPGLSARKATLQGFSPSGHPVTPTPAPTITSQAPARTLDRPSLAPRINKPGAQGQGAGTRPTPKSVSLAAGANKSVRPKRHRGPYSAALAEEDLRGAASTSEVLAAFFDFAAQYFEYAALFAVHGDIAEGREAAGPGLDRAGITAIGVPLDIESSLSRARDQNTFSLQHLAKTGLDFNLASDLLRPSEARVLILPVAVRGRCVLLLYGDAGTEDVELSEVGDVLSIAPLVSASLERILAQRRQPKGRSATPAQMMAAVKARPRFAAPTTEQRAQALAGALIPGSNTPRIATPSPAMRNDTPTRQTPLVNVPPSTAPPATAPPATAPPAIAPPATLPWAAQEQPALGSGNRTPVVPGPPQNRNLTKPFLLLADAPGRRAPDQVVEDDWEIPDDPMPATVANTSLRPPRRTSAPQATSEPTSALQRQQAQADALLGQLLAGNTAAEEDLIALGVSAIARVIAQFPGPILAPNSKDRPASECGPLLHILSRMGEAAIPFVVARTGDGDPQIRMWGTLLLAELPSAASIEAICRRLLDEDPEVARAARRSASELAKKPDQRTTVADALCTLLQNGSLSDDDRLGVLQTLVELKLEAAVPRLLRLLGNNPAVAQPTQWALRGLVYQDFGADPTAWESWWQANGDKGRVEWLVQALAHPTVELRRTAFAELRDLAQHDFGYRETLAAGPLQEVQRRYLEWWKTSGKARTT